MFLYEGYSCPVCQKPFTQSDDIVVCPVCGAPHHRSCWKAEGRCHFEETHGTPEQWSRDRAQTEYQNSQQADTTAFHSCPNCGYQNSIYAEFCSHCGKELQADEWDSTQSKNNVPPFETFSGYGEYRPFRAPMPDVGIADDTDLDGVTAKEIRVFVGPNSQYYVSKFHNLCQKKGRFSWNWAGFLLTPYWLWFRKQHIAGSIALLFDGIRTILTSFFLYGFLGVSSISSNAELTVRINQLSSSEAFGRWMFILYLLLFLDLLIRFFFGAFGNYLYFRTAKKRILSLRGNANTVALAAIGGTSALLAIVSYVLLYLISTISGFIFL